MQYTDHYRNQGDLIHAYRGNVLIGALGPIPDADQRYAMLARTPAGQPIAGLPKHLARHVLGEIGRIFVPQVEHDRAMEEAHYVVRQGYLHRNPLDVAHVKASAIATRIIADGALPEGDPRDLRLLGQLVSGTVGTGKSSVLAAIEASFPQRVIRHAYRVGDTDVIFTQVVHLKMSLTHNASLKAFADEFFGQLGTAIGRPQLGDEYGLKGSYSDAKAQIQVCRAIQEFHIGCIIVDDSQNMAFHSGGFSKVLNYFVKLMNSMGIALIVAGTSDTRTMISKDETHARRFVCDTPEFLPLMPAKPGERDGPFEAFMTKLFVHQYTAERADWRVLSQQFYRITGGVPDLIVKLFVLSQARCIWRGGKSIDAPLVTEIAEKLFSVVKDRVGEIMGKVRAKARIEDERRKMREKYEEILKEKEEAPLHVPPPAVVKKSAFVAQPVPESGDVHTPLGEGDFAVLT